MTSRHVIVTGGTRGIGEAISLRCVSDGAHVSALYQSNDDAAKSFLSKHGAAAASIHRVDLADIEACHEVVQIVRRLHGPVDALINNAGLLREAKLGEVTEADWNATVDVNLRSAFFLSQAIWSDLVTSGRGRIVNVGSVSASSGNSAQAAYAASKAGLTGLTRALARAGARKGVTVNLVVPGVFDTDMTRSMRQQDQDRVQSLIPVGRRGRTDEIAHIIAALLDDLGAYVTGAVIMVDGGLGMGH